MSLHATADLVYEPTGEQRPGKKRRPGDSGRFRSQGGSPPQGRVEVGFSKRGLVIWTSFGEGLDMYCNEYICNINNE